MSLDPAARRAGAEKMPHSAIVPAERGVGRLRRPTGRGHGRSVITLFVVGTNATSVADCAAPMPVA